MDEATAKELFNEELRCTLLGLEFDFERHTAVLRLPPLACTDMSGVIKFVRGIDSKVRDIMTVAGIKPDTRYVLDREKWTALDLRAAPAVATQNE